MNTLGRRELIDEASIRHQESVAAAMRIEHGDYWCGHKVHRKLITEKEVVIECDGYIVFTIQRAWPFETAMPKDAEIMDQAKVAMAFNAWMNDFVNNPKEFERIEDVACLHLREKLGDKPPTYGERSAAVLAEYMKKVGE